jgi:Flp pilus assembly protein TadG
MLYMVPVSFILLMGAGLVFDGGRAVAARARAGDVAAEAARAGAGAIDPASLRTAGPVRPRIDPAAAIPAARQVLTAAGAGGTITTSGRLVTVTAHVRTRTAILSAIGITDVSATATASAGDLHGVNTVAGQKAP